MPSLLGCMNGSIPTANGKSIIDAAYDFSRMVHGSSATSGDSFYRAFVPELGSVLSPRQHELVKRCMRSENGNIDRVGATVFPGLVKVSKGPNINGQEPEIIQVCTNIYVFFLLNGFLPVTDCGQKGTGKILGYHQDHPLKMILADNMWMCSNRWECCSTCHKYCINHSWSLKVYNSYSRV